jgi:hypothetical protein
MHLQSYREEESDNTRAAPREVSSNRNRGRSGGPCQVTLLVGARLTDYDLVVGSRTQEYLTDRRVRPVAQARHHLARLR